MARSDDFVLPLSDVVVEEPPRPEPIAIPIAPPVDDLPADSGSPVTLPTVDEALEPELGALLADARRLGASDLHLAADAPPMLRIDGVLVPATGYRTLTVHDVDDLVGPTMTEHQRERLEAEGEVRFAFAGPAGRFRLTVFRQRGLTSSTARVVPASAPALDALSLPAVLEHVGAVGSGLVVVAGARGSGRSTAVAAVVADVVRTRPAHVVTVEDPIEVVHEHGRGIVSQRELDSDVESASAGARASLGLDADVVVVGDLDDPTLLEHAVAAAESGRLVLATARGSSVGATLAALVDTAAPSDRARMRARLAATVQAVVCLTLCPSASGTGRVLAVDVLVATDAVRELVRDDHLEQLRQELAEGGKVGMVNLDQDLARLVRSGAITDDTAYERCADPAELRRALGGGG